MGRVRLNPCSNLSRYVSTVKSRLKPSNGDRETKNYAACLSAGPCSRQPESSRTQLSDPEARTGACASQSMSDQEASNSLVSVESLWPLDVGSHAHNLWH